MLVSLLDNLFVATFKVSSSRRWLPERRNGYEQTAAGDHVGDLDWVVTSSIQMVWSDSIWTCSSTELFDTLNGQAGQSNWRTIRMSSLSCWINWWSLSFGCERQIKETQTDRWVGSNKAVLTQQWRLLWIHGSWALVQKIGSKFVFLSILLFGYRVATGNWNHRHSQAPNHHLWIWDSNTTLSGIL